MFICQQVPCSTEASLIKVYFPFHFFIALLNRVIPCGSSMLNRYCHSFPLATAIAQPHALKSIEERRQQGAGEKCFPDEYSIVELDNSTPRQNHSMVCDGHGSDDSSFGGYSEPFLKCSFASDQYRSKRLVC